MNRAPRSFWPGVLLTAGRIREIAHSRNREFDRDLTLVSSAALASTVWTVFIEFVHWMNASSANRSEGAKARAALIYVVDDEPMILDLARAILIPEGHRVECFRDPATALQAFAAQEPRPDLVIADFNMHPMNGFEFLQAMRRIHPAQRVLMISGAVSASFFDSVACRPNRFLAKPYKAGQLLEAVQALLTPKTD